MSKRVLIVEDDTIASLYLQEFLKIKHLIIGAVETGEEAVAMAVAGRPDVMIVDIKLKGAMTGIEAVRKIRETLTIPVIYCTAYNDRGTIDKAEETAPAGIITKPVDTGELERILALIP
ncbi:MAG: response regulator [Spirochaetes bacterium]|nr:response regulator [Spirochaetota bacterium]